MHNIILICTVHFNNGLCNEIELCKIIENISPEIIFEEIPPSTFDDYYKYKSKNNLESNAINNYLKNYKCKHIPVDYDYIPSKLYFDEYGSVHHEVEKRSNIYKNIIDSQYIYKEYYGFKFLNSAYSVQLYRQLYDEIEVVLKLMNNEKITRINEKWKEIIEKRETEMINNIYNYCENNEFERGLFFIGAGHRESIIKKINNYIEKNILNINWNYNNYNNII